jgi:cell wall-associated NlpC family hydrolase
MSIPPPNLILPRGVSAGDPPQQSLQQPASAKNKRTAGIGSTSPNVTKQRTRWSKRIAAGLVVAPALAAGLLAVNLPHASAATDDGAATTRALSQVGHSYPVGWCQKFTNEEFGTGSVGDWDGDGDADAMDGWEKAEAKGIVVAADKINNLDQIPAGTMLYWSGGSHGHGHAAVSVGDGEMVSTDLPTAGRIGKVPISLVEQQWGLTFLGYVIKEGNGHTLITPEPEGTIQVVTTAKGLNARTSPKTGSVVTVRPPGTSIRVVKTKTVDGQQWAQGSHGLWYAAKYLQKR